MKKILLGVCNLGNGHINRQKQIISLLNSMNYNLCIVTAKIGDFSDNENKLNKIIYCSIPWIATNNSGIDFSECLNRHDGEDHYKNFLNMSIEIEKYFNGSPDIVITDYEPNVAKYAYSKNIKLINLEQQSKYLYLENLELNNISLNEEKSRLLYFFPKSDLRIISSFFPINSIKYNDYICVSPIIDKDKLEKRDGDSVLVYFSPYGDSEYYLLFEKIMKMINSIKNVNFIVYSNYEFEYYVSDNIKIKKFSDSFKKDLSNCKFVISTSGHQLISECIYLEKPMLLASFNTYEQNYNKNRIIYYNLGREIIDYTGMEIKSFLRNLDEYKSNIEKYNKEYSFIDWKDCIVDAIKDVND